MRVILIVIAVLTFAGCSGQSESEPGAKTSIPNVKISILQSGKILINGRESDIAQVKTRFKKLKSEGGTVWYYREAGQQKAPPEAMQVIKLVTEIKLPIMLSSKPDFSDYVNEDGRSYPREK